MTPRKLKIGFARFPYAGNGGCESEHPSIADWMVKTVQSIFSDDRCEKSIYRFSKADTPIPMVRNRALFEARKNGVDVLVMVDSDQIPDLMAPLGASPFWDTSFDFLYKHWHRGPCVVMAPYCGPPPNPVAGGECNVYMFRWATTANPKDRRAIKIVPFTREEAAARVGIEEVAAGPTGLIAIDMRCLEVIPKPWFDYEWADPPYNTEKGSTEDVYFTRNCSLSGVPVFSNWDCWAGHVKQEIVGKPVVMTAGDVRIEYAAAQQRAKAIFGRVMEVAPGESVEEIAASLDLRIPGAVASGNGMARRRGARAKQKQGRK
jgi:hypothetical protein